jgi:hypothetical protein
MRGPGSVFLRYMNTHCGQMFKGPFPWILDLHLQVLAQTGVLSLEFWLAHACNTFVCSPSGALDDIDQHESSFEIDHFRALQPW